MQNFRKNTHHNKPENIIYGIHPVKEALDAGKEIEKILIQRDVKNPNIRQILDSSSLLGVPVQKVPVEKLNGLVRGTHQGIIAFVSLIDYQPLDNILPAIYEKGESPLLLMLDRVTDVRNFGAIARSAECAGVNAIIVPSRGSALINADAMKTSAGALNNIPIHRSHNLKDTLRYLKDSGVKIVAVSEYGDKNYDRFDLTGPVLLLLGSEEDGISPEYIKFADGNIRIPIVGMTGSLNVSVAAGVVIFEALRQRSERGS